ncbi:type II toxin-antitoxin system VapC family toxin [Kitasatospora sp. NPDC127111]|uniref:type II toxin-antitoxin system VapC family toxin n=1 Tax=Kitasatospora sp. NPDC127111 TaxID=3345363 RepID=UPI0036318411
MIVVDASAVVEALVGAGPTADQVRQRLTGEDVYAPAHLDHEVSRVIGRLLQKKLLTEQDAQAAIEDLDALEVQRIPIPGLLLRAWELRHNTYVGDAIYISLAETLRCPLVTTDGKMAGVPGISCPVEHIPKV